MTARRAFWRTESTFATRTAAERRARAVRWAPFVIERGLTVRVNPLGDRWIVELGANDPRLLRTEG